jgi:hypothetical protein
VVGIIDIPLSLILLLDFGARLARAADRWYYLVREGRWLDLLGSLPPPPMKLRPCVAVRGPSISTTPNCSTLTSQKFIHCTAAPSDANLRASHEEGPAPSAPVLS